MSKGVSGLSSLTSLSCGAVRGELDDGFHTTSTMDHEWDAKEELHLRELEEARARTAQMEKTMRWWSDCTANWREKWSKVRTERNKAREEARLIRSKLESSIKDLSIARREKAEVLQENQQLRQEIEKMKTATTDVEQASSSPNHNTSVEVSNEPVSFPELIELDTELAALKLDTSRAAKAERVDADSPASVSRLEADLSEQKVKMLSLHLQEATKSLHKEREDKTAMSTNIDALQEEVRSLRSRCEHLRLARQEALAHIVQLEARHRDQIASVKLDLQDETCSRQNMDQRLAELRTELECLQAENAAEWGKRERLETEKLSMQREQKKLRAQVQELTETLELRDQTLSTLAHQDMKKIQQEVIDKTTELAELKHAHSKLKKVLADKSVELGHALRRGEGWEGEVRRLRNRVDELKYQLAQAEDQVDQGTNNVRKLQRSNDELQEHVDTLQVQVEHLESRLRGCQQSGTSLVSPRHQDDCDSDLEQDEY